MSVPNHKELVKLALLTEQFGVLHELQLQQLKKWPFLLFEDLKQFELLPVVIDKQVIYDFVMFDSKELPVDKKDRFKLLNEWVKDIMGTNWSIKVLIKDISVYNG